MKKVIITGGAGYIGSHICYELLDNNYKIIIIDNLSTGQKKLVPEDSFFYKGDFSDPELLNKIFNDHEIDSVIHCAALIDASDSLNKPIEYYRENAAKTMNLIAFCANRNLSKFLFSSTAAVYGNPESAEVDEETYCAPITPYGSSKFMAEKFIYDFAPCTSINFGIMRYFNVAGADPKGRTGQPNRNATNVFSSLCRAILHEQEFTIYGNDYNTDDGTCVRDFIHVSDLASAHRIFLEYLDNKQEKPNCKNTPFLINCGYGHGFSILELINAAESLITKKIQYKFGERRNGDIEKIIASTDKIRGNLLWKPQHDNLSELIKTSLEWERNISD